MRTWSWFIVFCLACFPLLADGKASRKKLPNMPAGWTWPPSASMQEDGERCLERLSALGVAWEKGPDTRKIATPIVVPDMTFGSVELVAIFRKPPFVMDCHLALALTRHSEALHQLGVRQLRFSSIHSYRKIRLRGAKTRPLSRHALGLAVDVYEVVMASGATLVIERNYKSRKVLRAVERAINDTGGFRTVLSPGNDPRSHHDHFHISARMPQSE